MIDRSVIKKFLNKKVLLIDNETGKQIKTVIVGYTLKAPNVKDYLIALIETKEQKDLFWWYWKDRRKTEYILPEYFIVDTNGYCYVEESEITLI